MGRSRHLALFSLFLSCLVGGGCLWTEYVGDVYDGNRDVA